MKKRVEIVINPAKKMPEQRIPFVIATRKEIPDIPMTRYAKFPDCVGKMLRTHGNTVIGMSNAKKYGGDGIVRSIKKQFGIDVIAYISENDNLILERKR